MYIPLKAFCGFQEGRMWKAGDRLPAICTHASSNEEFASILRSGTGTQKNLIFSVLCVSFSSIVARRIQSLRYSSVNHC